jgi:hypothetical protein
MFGKQPTCDENNLFVYKDGNRIDGTGTLRVVEVVEQVESSQNGLLITVRVSPNVDYTTWCEKVPVASLIPFDLECYRRLVIILEEDAAASGYELDERDRLFEFHGRARLALCTLANMRPDYEAGFRHIEEFLEERKYSHPDVFNRDDATTYRCSRCRGVPCYTHCFERVIERARM